MRADIFLVEQGYAKSRSEAKAAIEAGLVRAEGVLLLKPSQAISSGASIEYQKPHPFVSRAGGKLAAALDHFDLSPKERVCLDVGASTGGFTQVLLERGAARVYALDVGQNQMHPSLANDPRVRLREGVNARALKASDLPEPVSVLTVDVSFISAKLVLLPALSLVAPNSWAVVLVKPQFEVGRKAIGKGGIVRDQAARTSALESISDFIAEKPQWRVLGTMESPLLGGDGNLEYLLAAAKL